MGIDKGRWRRQGDEWVYEPPLDEDAAARRDREVRDRINERLEWAWRDGDAYYDATWDDRQAGEQTGNYQDNGGFVLRVYYDEDSGEFRCHCVSYRKYGRCGHLYRYRHTIDVRVDKRYL